MDPVFYEGGLHFKCARCSSCCRHEPGYVFLTASDVENLKKATGLSGSRVRAKFCRIVFLGIIERLSLKEKENYDCIFWNEGGCTIYKRRPLQCKTYPFWSANLISRESWDLLQNTCPGVNEGRLYSRNEIDCFVAMREQKPLLSK
ncbi:MAG: zinc/iron-chelating domain-containing protein [Spirochaetales bacterium]|nr:zinc/iron-chelating domain-containing protein [Spirochaetales bacterium]